MTSEFFSASAQIVPVLLLALALDARVFGSVPRARRTDRAARNIERARGLLEFATALVLIAAEVQSLAALRNSSGGDPWLACVGLAWGFVALCAIAVLGMGRRARVTADIEIDRQTSDGIVVKFGVSNEFGDRDVEPLMNVLLGPDVEAYDWDADQAMPVQRYSLPLTAPVVVDGKTTIQCRYSDERLPLSAGDAGVSYVLLKFKANEALVVVRLDHMQFKGGRVEQAAWLLRGPPPSLERIDRPTS